MASPGPCLPVLGHSYLLFKKSVLEDPANGIWKLYRNHNRDGILHMNTFSLNTVWIGDYKKIKYLFNLPEVTARLNKTMLELALPSRRVQGPEMPGILFSDGQTWHQRKCWLHLPQMVGQCAVRTTLFATAMKFWQKMQVVNARCNVL